MVLVDTSIWVDHLNRGNERLTRLLEDGLVVCHPYVIGELACGRLKNRREVLGLLQALPQAPVAEQEELLRLVDTHRLYGRGLGWIDIHLLGGALLSSCAIWTGDKGLIAAARALGIAAGNDRSR